MAADSWVRQLGRTKSEDPLVARAYDEGLRQCAGQAYGGLVPSGESLPNTSGPPNPGRIHTLAEFAAALNLRRAGRSYAALDRAVGGVPTRRVLPPSTVSDLFKGKSIPSRDTVVTFLTACGLDGDAQQPWLAAWERVSTAHLRKPVGAVRVRDADPRRLGVHASIQVDRGAEDLPMYVPRDLDADLRTAITAAAERGGFVLAKGSSSVGKTRVLFETVQVVLPDWWVLHPADAAAVRAFANAPAPRTVVWLDELQRYLNQPGGVPAGCVRALLAAGLVVVATLWPDEYASRATQRSPGQADPYAEDREVLGLARIIEVSGAFTPKERRRAEELATEDRRIQEALDTKDAGLTQVLAAGPELIRWWEHADVTDLRQCYGKAAITAALDARRIGAYAPLNREFFLDAVPAYLSSTQQAIAPADWLDRALDYAVTRLRGAASCLVPSATAMGEVSGWISADYLHQHARRVRRTEPVPEQVWHAIGEHHRNADDLYWIAEHAERRGHRHHAVNFYRQAAHCGDREATVKLNHWLMEQGHVEELRQRANAGEEVAAIMLSQLLAKQGRVEELKERAEAGDQPAAQSVMELAIQEGSPEALEEATALWYRADAAERDRRSRDAGGAVPVRPSVGNDQSTRPRWIGCIDARVIDRGVDHWVEPDALEHLSVDELRERADHGDRLAARQLVKLLILQGRIEELELEVRAGTPGAFDRLMLLSRAGESPEQGPTQTSSKEP